MTIAGIPYRFAVHKKNIIVAYNKNDLMDSIKLWICKEKKMLDPVIIGKNIRFFRELKGETQKQLGEIIGCSASSIRAYENGINRDEDIIRRIANHYNVSFRQITESDFNNLGINIKKEGKISSQLFKEDKYNHFIEALSYKEFSKKALKDADINIASHIMDSMEGLIEYKEFHEKANQLLKILHGKLLDKTIELNDRQTCAINIIVTLIDEENGRRQNPEYIKYCKEHLENETIEIKELHHRTRKIKENQDDKLHDEKIKMIMQCIYCLRMNDEYRDLAEFYNSYRYIVGLGRKKRSLGEQVDFGMELLVDLVTYENIYAIEFLKMNKDILVDV